MNWKFKTQNDMNFKLQIVKGKTRLKIHQIITDYYDQTNYMRQSNSFKFGESRFGKVAQSIVSIMHESLFLIRLSQRKP